MAERVGLFAAGRPLIPRFARDRPAVVSHPFAVPLTAVRRWPRRDSRAADGKCLAERVGFEPTCRFYPTIRFRVGAVMTASVPLRTQATWAVLRAGILAESSSPGGLPWCGL